MALPVSSKDLVRYQPGVLASEGEDDSKPVYLIGIATVMERARYNRDVAKTGARFIANEDIWSALRRGAKECLTEEDFGRASGFLDDFELMQKELKAKIKTIGDLEEAEKEHLKQFEKKSEGDGEKEEKEDPAIADQKAQRREILENVKVIEETVSANVPEYRELVADREYWWTVSRIVACRHFLRGWERVTDADEKPAEFRKHNMLASEECLEHIPERTQLRIGAKALLLMAPEKAQAKN